MPIVHHIGGLVKVVDGVTGLAYEENSPETLAQAMHRALELFQDSQRIRDMQVAALEKISKEHSWRQVMKEYVDLYKAARVDTNI